MILDTYANAHCGLSVMLTRRALLGGVAAAPLLLPCVAARAAFNSKPSSIPWQPLRIGGGGQLNFVDIANDGTTICGADVFGAYLWKGSKWQPLPTTSALPREAWSTPLSGTGAYAGRVCRSNSQIIYLVTGNFSQNSRAYVSQNQGASFSRCGSSFQEAMVSNGGSYRYGGNHMDVDPNHPNRVILATQSAGVWITTNGLSGSSATWSRISGIANNDRNNLGCVVIDGNSGTNGSGYSNKAYVSVSGTGLYYTTYGGSSWTLITSAGTEIWRLALGTDGTLYIINGFAGGTALHRMTWSGGTPTITRITPTTITSNIGCVVCDPTNANHITVFSGSNTRGNYYQDSRTQGSSWSRASATVPTVNTSMVPWHANLFNLLHSQGNGVQPLDMKADPSGTGYIIACSFQSVIRTSYPIESSAGTTQAWTDIGLGIEEMVNYCICIPPGGNGTILVGCADCGLITVTDPPNTPPSYQYNTGGTIVACHWIDYASSNPEYVVAIFGGFLPAQVGGTNGAAVSSNYGQTWTLASSQPSVRGSALEMGGIAAASPTNWIWQPMDNSSARWAPCYTFNGGKSWAEVSGPPALGWNATGYQPCCHVAADRVNYNSGGTGIGTFYMLNNSPALWVSTNGGVSWTEYRLSINTGWYGGTLKTVPNNAGHMFLAGWTGGGGNYNPSIMPFYRLIYTGSAVTVQRTGLHNVFDFGFGAPANGANYPAIYAYGYYNGTLGMWRSIDTTASSIGTWHQLTNSNPDGGIYPDGWIDWTYMVAASMDTYGVVCCGNQGSTAEYGKFP